MQRGGNPEGGEGGKEDDISLPKTTPIRENDLKRLEGKNFFGGGEG